MKKGQIAKLQGVSGWKTKLITCEIESEKKMKIKSKSYVEAIDHEGQQYQRQAGSTWFKVVGDTLEGVYGREEHRLERAYREAKYANQVKEDAGAVAVHCFVRRCDWS